MCAQDCVYLVSCLLNSRRPDAERVSSLNLEELYRFACAHSVAGITAFALENAGVHDQRFTAAKGNAIRKVLLLSMDRERVIRELETAGVWHMTLKGSVLKDYYPALGMRESADCDILIDPTRALDVREIMKSLGFTVEEFGHYHHDMYSKAPVSDFEMHRKLFMEESGETLCRYYADVKNRLIRDNGSSYGYHFSDEDFYVYMTAHEFKHYAEGGTGLRSLLDVYVFLKKFSDQLDWNYLTHELETAGLSDFERRNRELSLRLFDGRGLTDEDREMLNYILSSGTYGTIEHAVMSRLKKNPQSKVKYILSRIFVPMSEIRDKYPFYYEHKYLIPVLWIQRVIKAVRRRDRALAEFRTVIKQ